MRFSSIVTNRVCHIKLTTVNSACSIYNWYFYLSFDAMMCVAFAANGCFGFWNDYLSCVYNDNLEKSIRCKHSGWLAYVWYSDRPCLSLLFLYCFSFAFNSKILTGGRTNFSDIMWFVNISQLSCCSVW